ncbi:macrolide family glycosyltransferase [Nocardiopsis mangrovi]|uniref:Macrolide family glycosyltransferase n=1 Tax=Nocardiopsis mangrovi TaxID=1179818 RepID=A0ABV9DT25_9ACTN
MHVFFTSIGAAGHINPTLPLVRELVGRGHRVSYATDERLRFAIESVGAALVPLPELALPVVNSASHPGDWGTVMRHMMETLIRYQSQIIGDGIIDDYVELQRPDAVCYDNTLTIPGRRAADRVGVPAIALHPTYAANENFSFQSMAESGAGNAPGETGNLFQQMREVGLELADEMGGQAINLFEGPPAPLNIVFIPREFQPAADTFDERFHFVGPSLGARNDDGTWTPPGGGPLLFISLGTSPFNRNTEFYQMCIDAFGDGKWRVALAIGTQVDPAELGSAPPNVEIRPHFPQLDVLRNADIFLSHTGMNSTMESLYHGVPIVAVPQQPEQVANARQIEQLGLGRHLTGRLSPDLIRQAVEDVHADPAVAGNVTDMSRVLQKSGGARAAADAIESHLGARLNP